MKTVFDKAAVHADKCPGCSICVKVCPTTAIHMRTKLAVIDENECFGCNACAQACPFDAIAMVPTQEETDPRTADSRLRPPWTIEDEQVSSATEQAARDLCVRAGFHPDQQLCVCVDDSRAHKVAEMVLDSKTQPDVLALSTGLRSGCTILCIAGLVRMLEAAGIDVEQPSKDSWNWYPGSPAQASLPADLDARYAALGYRFAEDTKLMADVVARANAGSPPAASGQ